MEREKKLVLVTVDCLRADHLGCYGYHRATTPHLDRLSPECWLFEWALAAGVPTYYSFPAIMASRYPLSLGRDVVGLAAGESTLATVLQAAGYPTAAFVAGNPYLSSRDHYQHGFESFEDFLKADRTRDVQAEVRPPLRRRMVQAVGRLAGRWRITELIFKELYFQLWAVRRARRGRTMDKLRRYPSAERVVHRALAWLDERAGEPFFLWLHLMDPHDPYYPNEPALAMLGLPDMPAHRALLLNAVWKRPELSHRRLERYRRDILGLYDAGIRWVDEQIHHLVSHLEARGLWNDTLFVVTGDHGEEFLEHGGRFHFPVSLCRELTHVPLLIRHPAGSSAGRIAQIFSLIDLAPTLLSILGIEPPASFRGQSRWRGGRFECGSTPVITECVYDRKNPWNPGQESGARLLAAQNQSHKLVVNFATGCDCLFDLVNDPEELLPLDNAAAHPARAALLKAMLEHLCRHRADLTSEVCLQANLARIRQSILHRPSDRWPAADERR